MSNIVLVLGQSGSGKSYSLKNLDPEKTAIISPISKAFPFRSSFKRKVTDEWREISESMISASDKGYKVIVIEDFQYVMVNEFMKRIDEKGYGKFNDIAAHAWTIVNASANLKDDVRVYFICQSEVDDFGKEKMKTIGKALDNIVDLQGLFTTLVLAKNNEGKFTFRTKSLGDSIDSVKAPEGMIEHESIPNDLSILDGYVNDFFNPTEEKEDIKENDKEEVENGEEAEEEDLFN